jgi:hypothetical protein
VLGLDRLAALVGGLVVAVVVLGADEDEADLLGTGTGPVAGGGDGGAGGGAARMFSSRYFPRIVGAVRVEYDVTDRSAALPSRPKRFSSVSVTRRKFSPLMFAMP